MITDNQMIFVWMDVLSLLRVQIRNKCFWGKLYLADTSNKHVKHEHYVPSIMRKVSLVPFCFVEFICCYFVCNETIPCRYWKTSFDQQIFRNAYEYLVNKATNQTLTVVGVSSPPYIIYRIIQKRKITILIIKLITILIIKMIITISIILIRKGGRKSKWWTTARFSLRGKPGWGSSWEHAMAISTTIEAAP